MNIAFKLYHTPKWRLFLHQCERFEVGISIDLRDVWIGLYWRRERFVNHDETLQLIDDIACIATPEEIRDVARQALGSPVWQASWELYFCPIPFLVFSLRFT